MNQSLTKNAQSIQTVLEQKGLDCEVRELPGSTRTAVDAASSIGCDVAQILKSLIFKTKVSEKPVLVLASGPNRVNEKTVASFLSEEIIKADAEFAREITGFAIGGIPPIGHKQSIQFIFIDQDLLKFDSVWAAAGTPNAVFNIQSKDLLSITNGKMIAVD